MAAERFQILALDGGGFKGMFPAALLACLEADLGIKVTDHFDLMTGASTGGIIALGLGAGLKPSEITDFYVDQGPEIFGSPRRRVVRRLARSKYSSAPLRRALEEVFGEQTLAESKVALTIPAYDLCNDNVYLFRTPHSKQLRRDGREKMVDVALATSAAPTYLPAHQLRGLRLVDGGMWANNPALVGLVEACRSFGRSLSEVRICSLGTTAATTFRRSRLDRGGLAAWSVSAIDVVLRGQSLGVRNAVNLLLGHDNVLRVDPQVPDKELRLDGVSPDQLRGRAEHVSRHTSARFKKLFTDHQAQPLHR